METTQTKSIESGMVFKNVSPAGRTLATVRVISRLNIGGESMYRVCDVKETASDAQLVSRNRTWAVPAQNLVAIESSGCPMMF
jgi:hypothetical protein